jgi:molybdate transport system substrate-binding protein
LTEATGERDVVKAMCGLAIMGAVNQTILPAYRAGGHDADIIWDPTTRLMERVNAGERADVVVAITWAIDELMSRGIVSADSRTPVARAQLGIAVRAGAPKPDIGTVEALRQTLLAAPSIVYSRAGASGIYFEQLIDKLGIGAEVRAKSIVIPAGLTAELLPHGQAEMAIQQISELMAVPGVDVVGPVPADVQTNTDFEAAIFTEASNPAGARRFIAALVSPQARRAYEATGLVPLFE